MNANVRGTMFVKADRINARIEKAKEVVLNEQRYFGLKEIPKETFLDFVKTMHIIVDTELTEKGAKDDGRNN